MADAEEDNAVAVAVAVDVAAEAEAEAGSVIDLTDDSAEAGGAGDAADEVKSDSTAASSPPKSKRSSPSRITPDRPAKAPKDGGGRGPRRSGTRTSRRLRDAQEEEEEAERPPKRTKAGEGGGDDEGAEDDDDDAPEYVGENKGGYFEVDKVLDRRTRKYGSESAGVRHVVEYLVSWKIPPEYDGPSSYYDPVWLIAENLDQNSLASAFEKFPAEGDVAPHGDGGGGARRSARAAKAENGGEEEESELEFSDDEEESEEEEDEGEEADGSADDVLREYDDDEGRGKRAPDGPKDPNVSRLEDSDYDSPGTVELVLNRRTYRVGQSYYASPAEDVIYTISVILPMPRKARYKKYVRLTKCFVCPPGKEEAYVLVGGGVELELSALKLPRKTEFEVLEGMRYEEEDERQRKFAYVRDGGRVSYKFEGRPTALELYAGAGGMSLGLEKHFDMRWAVERDPLAAATLRANKANSNKHIYTEDVKAFLKRCVRGDPCYPAAGTVDHIHASPPCKGFSRANRNGGKDDMINNKQTLLFVKAIQHFRPKTVSFENVPGLVLEDYRGYLQLVVSSLLRMRYQVRVEVLAATSYGDPQKRRRLILLAAREDCLLPDAPAPTHGDGPGLLPIKTCKDALRALEGREPASSKSSGAVRVGDAVIFNHVVPGGTRERKDGDFELVEDEPSRTILTKSRSHLHYSAGRPISVREAACLQSFPATYRFFGGLSSQYSQVGNAVPVGLATAIARSVAVVHGCAV